MSARLLPVVHEGPVVERRRDGRWLVAGTELPFELFMGCYQRGETPQEIVEGFPGVPLATAHRVIAYYLDHQREVDAWLKEVDREAEELFQRYEELHPSQPTRALILDRAAEIRAPRPD